MAEHKITPVPKEVKSASGAIDHYADQRTAEVIKTAPTRSESAQIPPPLHSAAAQSDNIEATHLQPEPSEPIKTAEFARIGAEIPQTGQSALSLQPAAVIRAEGVAALGQSEPSEPNQAPKSARTSAVTPQAEQSTPPLQPASLRAEGIAAEQPEPHIKTFKPTLKTAASVSIKAAKSTLAAEARAFAAQSASSENEGQAATAAVGMLSAPPKAVAGTAAKILKKTGHNTLARTAKGVAIAASAADALAAQAQGDNADGAPADVVALSVQRVVGAGGKHTLKKVLRPIRTVREAKAATKKAKNAVKAFKPTAKSTINITKTGATNIKVSFQSARAALKATAQTVKTAGVASQATAAAARRSAIAIKDVVTASARATVRSVKAAIAAVKATVQTTGSLIGAVAAGGWVAVVAIILVVVLVATCASAFSIFANSSNRASIRSVENEIIDEYCDKEQDILQRAGNPEWAISEGTPPDMRDVLAVYAVKVTTDPTNPDEVATMTDVKARTLKSIYWDMCSLSSYTETRAVVEHLSSYDGTLDAWVQYDQVVQKPILCVKTVAKTAAQAADLYGFSADQRAMLAALLDSNTADQWDALLANDTTSDREAFLNVARSQLGNVGGEAYLSRLGIGYEMRMDWSTCFVSYCANECGYVAAGKLPDEWWAPNLQEFLVLRGRFRLPLLYRPAPGDVVLFDRADASGSRDGWVDAAGIVESVEDQNICVIEGDSSNVCCRNHYNLSSPDIVGYGTY